MLIMFMAATIILALVGNELADEGLKRICLGFVIASYEAPHGQAWAQLSARTMA